MSKYKYYLKKPRSEIVKDILKGLILTGAICIAASSPYFSINIIKGFKKWWRGGNKYKNKKVCNTFYQLRKDNCINFENKNGQIYISLTEKGKKKAGWMQIDELKIKRPKKWDGFWWVVLFDIAQLKRLYRNALRGKLKEFGFYCLQKSVWVYPFDCRDEIYLLKDFFGFKNHEFRLIHTKDIGDDKELCKFFKLN